MIKIELTIEDLKNLQAIIEYLSDSEKKSYEERMLNDFEDLLDENIDHFNFIFDKDFYNQPSISHIYAITQRVNDAVYSYFIKNSI